MCTPGWGLTVRASRGWSEASASPAMETYEAERSLCPWSPRRGAAAAAAHLTRNHEVVALIPQWVKDPVLRP